MTEILKAPFKGVFSNNKLKIKESITINCILACVFAIAIVASTKTLASDFSTGISMMFIENLINEMLIRAFILIVINFVAIILVFSGIIYVISKSIFKLEVSYEECVSACTYANIMPTFIMILGVIFSLFSITLSIITIAIQIMVLIILTYEGLSSLLIAGKSKLMYSIVFAYILNIVLFAAANYLVIRSMVESRIQSLFW